MLGDYVQPFVPSLRSVIIFFFVVYIPLYLFSITFFGRRTRKSPFVFPSLLKGNAEPVVSNKRQRHAVLRQYFNAKRVPDRVDVIVVGSQLGGLVTASLLARSGFRVLVLERRAAAGGLQSEESCLVEFELEQHWGGMAPGTMARMILDQVTNAQVHWVPVEADFDSICVLRDSAFLHRLAVTKGAEVFRQRLLEAFPSEATAIRCYFDLLDKAESSWWHPLWAKLFPIQLVRLLHRIGIFPFFSSFFRLSHRSLQEVLDEVTSCEELKTLLAYSCLSRGLSPRHVAFVAYALRMKQLLQSGAAYPQGGYEELAFRMGNLIESAKGKILVNASVVELLSNKKRVTGVRVITDDKVVDVFAKTVILAEGVGAAQQLLPDELRKSAAWISNCNHLLRPPTVMIHLHLWLEACPEEVGLPSQNIHLCFKDAGYSDDMALEEWLRCSPDEATRQVPPFLILSVPSAKDLQWQKRLGSGSGSLIIASFAAARSWGSKLRVDSELRKRLVDSLWPHMCRVRPNLETTRITQVSVRVEDEPLRLTECPQRYGAEMQVRLRPNFGPRGLLFTGSDLVADGVLGELHGALLCTSFFLNRHLSGELTKMSSGAVSKRATRIRK